MRNMVRLISHMALIGSKRLLIVSCVNFSRLNRATSSLMFLQKRSTSISWRKLVTCLHGFSLLQTTQISSLIFRLITGEDMVRDAHAVTKCHAHALHHGSKNTVRHNALEKGETKRPYVMNVRPLLF